MRKNNNNKNNDGKESDDDESVDVHVIDENNVLEEFEKKTHTTPLREIISIQNNDNSSRGNSMNSINNNTAGTTTNNSNVLNNVLNYTQLNVIAPRPTPRSSIHLDSIIINNNDSGKAKDLTLYL